ncbi:MAG TPA: carboxymuconolactone decarboxylase family protein [Roseomonas sp.]|jgi:4-carboxymuconolactone decarboxylase
MRLPDADPGQSPKLHAIFSDFERTRGRGISNVMKSFAHAPDGLELIEALGRYCRYGTELSELQKELVILITGRAVPYAWAHHAPLGLEAGMTQAQLNTIQAGRVPTELTPTDQAIAEYVLAYTTLRGVPEAVFARLTGLLSPRQVTDVNIIAGYYLCIAASIIGMDVQFDPDLLPAGGKG